jgi:mRNA interferase MazF
MKGKIIAVPFPFTNLKGAKVRPALVIYEGREDVIVAFISSKIPVERYNVDVLLTSKMPVFRLSGLKRDSVIQLNKLATLDKSLIEGEFGEIDSDLMREVQKILVDIFSH